MDLQQILAWLQQLQSWLLDLWDNIVNLVGDPEEMFFVSLVIELIASLFVQKRFLQRFSKHTTKIIISSLFIMALAASFYSYSAASSTHPAGYPIRNVILPFCASILLWAIDFHVAAYEFGYRITYFNWWHWLQWLSPFSKNWPRVIDYIYTIITSFSIFKIVLGDVSGKDELHYFDAWGAEFLTIALALRLTRNTAEIFKWHKKRPPARSEPRSTSQAGS